MCAAPDGGIRFKMDKTAKIVVALVIIVVTGFFVFSKISGWHKSKVETAVKKEQEVWQDKADKLEQEVTELKQELTEVKGQEVPEEKLSKIFGVEEKEEQPPVEAKNTTAKKMSEYAETERQIKAFFTYLDSRPYVQSLNLAGGSYLQYQLAIEKLSAKPPIIVGEMDSLYNMVRNVAHFYRVMGKKRVQLTRQILQNESEVIETTMKTFYQWYIMDDQGSATLNGRPSMTAMYEYSGYILNTLGGRSYLLRRSPKVRTLTTYYSVLILDRANDEELNSRGIDIRPYIKSSLLEIKNQIGLIHQKEYITRLSELSLKYT
jgi:NADH:ubiquinone oxidoreductase subunit C